MERQPTTDRMIQEYVPGKQVTLAHIIANADQGRLPTAFTAPPTRH